MSLTGKTVSSTYKSLLRVNDDTNGVDGTLEVVTDGEGTHSVMHLSDDEFKVQPKNNNSNNAFTATNTSGDRLLQVDAANNHVRINQGLQIANTAIKQFMLTSINGYPATGNTWTMLDATCGGRFNSAPIEMGTGSTPDTTYTNTAQAMNLAQSVWFVPFNIAIDACNVWFGQDDASGDVVKFSVMSYAIIADNTANSGNLSDGTEVCVSPSTITGAGYEQAYYQALTISSADVASGRAIVACVHQNGTNSDLTVNMQLVYHIR